MHKWTRCTRRRKRRKALTKERVTLLRKQNRGSALSFGTVEIWTICLFSIDGFPVRYVAKFVTCRVHWLTISRSNCPLPNCLHKLSWHSRLLNVTEPFLLVWILFFSLRTAFVLFLTKCLDGFNGFCRILPSLSQNTTNLLFHLHDKSFEFVFNLCEPHS